MATTTEAYAYRADEYIELVGSVEAAHPSDRHLLSAWAGSVQGRLLDAGCGPGHWTDHFTTLGVDVHGVDLVLPFIEHARRTYPSSRFEVQSIDALHEPDGALGGILSWFSTIHHEPSRISVPIREFARTLRPGGSLALGYFDGTEVEDFEHKVTRAFRWPARELQQVLDAAGFDIDEIHRRTTRGHRPVGTIIATRRATGIEPAHV